jgi:hypothetical protein
MWAKIGLDVDYNRSLNGNIMELRVKIDDQFVDDIKSKLQKKLGETSGTRITQDALALYKWAVDEASKGRVIVSSNPEGNDVQRVVMPALNV